MKPLFRRFLGSLEVSVEKTLESLSVSCLVLCHFVNCVVDSVEVESLCLLCKVKLACGSAVLSFYALCEVLLGGRRNYLAEKLSELCSVLCLFPCSLLVVETYLGIALAVSGSCHCKVHADLCALAGEVSAQTLNDLLGNALELANADLMLVSENQLAAVVIDNSELGAGNAALRALLRSCVALVNIAAYRTYKFHNDLPPLI